MEAFKSDVHLLYENAVTFNGVSHKIADSAMSVRDSIFAKIEKIPPEDTEAPEHDTRARRRTLGSSGIVPQKRKLRQTQ